MIRNSVNEMSFSSCDYIFGCFLLDLAGIILVIIIIVIYLHNKYKYINTSTVLHTERFSVGVARINICPVNDPTNHWQ